MNVFPVTQSQAAMWYAGVLAAQSAAYHVPVIWCLEESRARAQPAIDRLIAETPELRLRMGLDSSGAVVQWRGSERPTVCWLSTPVTETVDGEVDPLLQQFIQQPFDLDGRPLCRLVGASTTSGRTLLLLVAHHAILDGTAQEVISRRLASCLTTTKPSRPTHELGAYLRLVDHVREREAAAETMYRDYWERRIGAYMRRAVPGVPTATGSRHVPVAAQDATGFNRTSLPSDAVAGLDQLCRATGTSRFMAMVAVVHCLLGGLGARAAAVAVATSLRPRGDDPDVAGYFVNQIPLFAALRRRESLTDLIHRQHEEWRADLRTRYVPYLTLCDLARSAGAGAEWLAPVLLTYRTVAKDASYSLVHADPFIRYSGGRTEVLIRVIDRGSALDCDVEWRPGVAHVLGPGLGKAVAERLVP